MFLTTFWGDFGPLGGVTHFPGSRQACMKCFEGGRGVFSRVPPVRSSTIFISQTQKPGNPGVLRYIPDQTGVVSGPKKVPKILGRAGSDSGWQRCQNGSGPARPGPASQTLAKKIHNVLFSKKDCFQKGILKKRIFRKKYFFDFFSKNNFF